MCEIKITIKENPKNVEKLVKIIQEIEEIMKSRKINLLKIEIIPQDKTNDDRNNLEIENQPTRSINQAQIKRIPPDLLNCDLCQYKSYRKDHLIGHMKSRHCEGKLCHICSKFLDSENSYFHHKQLNHPPVKCEFSGCQKKFNHKSNMKLHYKRVHLKTSLIKRFVCDLCCWKTDRKCRMIDHIESRHLNKKYKCETCEENFNTKYSLDHHIRQKHRQFICEICNRIFNTERVLIKHVKLQHLNEKKSFKCDICPKKFTLKSDLTKHKKRSHGKLEFKCEFAGCNKMFRQLFSMNVHYNRIHLKLKKEKRVQCDLCGYKADYKSFIKQHIISIHLKKRDFKCKICGFKTCRKDLLTQHQQKMMEPAKKRELHATKNYRELHEMYVKQNQRN